MDLQEYKQKVIELDAELIVSFFEGQVVTYHIIKWKFDWTDYKVRQAVKYLLENKKATERIGLITIVERYPWQAINKVFVADMEC